MRLSLLDRSRTRVGRADAEALRQTVDRARRAESLGFHRFWVAEHHAVPGVASGSPAVLLAAIGQVTGTIRLGSGGVMLPQHQPFVVAEQFRMLEALFPGRVDLGLGRSLGFTAPVRRALRREHTADSAHFAADVEELLGYLDDSGEVTARPVTGPPQVFLLANRAGSMIAARLGLPLVLGAGSLDTTELSDRVAAYRREFRPRPTPLAPQRPEVILSLDVFIADSVQAARELALPEAWAMARSRQTGEFPPLMHPRDILGEPWPQQLARRVETQLDRPVLGSRATVEAALGLLLERTGAEEILVSTSTYDPAALAELDTALAGLSGSSR